MVATNSWSVHEYACRTNVCAGWGVAPVFVDFWVKRAHGPIVWALDETGSVQWPICLSNDCSVGAKGPERLATRGLIIINAFAFSFRLSLGQPVSCTILINNHVVWHIAHAHIINRYLLYVALNGRNESNARRCYFKLALFQVMVLISAPPASRCYETHHHYFPVPIYF